MPASEKGTYVSLLAGPAWPRGSFGNVADMGYEVDASAHWRRWRRMELGVRLEYASWAGQDEIYAPFGEVDQVSFRSLGASLFARWLIFRQPRYDPFLYVAYGGGRFTTSLEGPAVSGSDTESAFHSELGLGVRWKTSKRTGVELVVATAGRSLGDGYTQAGNTLFYTGGTAGSRLVRIGFVRRLGGGE